MFSMQICSEICFSPIKNAILIIGISYEKNMFSKNIIILLTNYFHYVTLKTVKNLYFEVNIVAKEISDDLSSCINKLFKKEIPQKYYSSALTGSPILLNAMQMVYLLREIEQKYNITIEAKDFLSGRFNSIEGITEILREKGVQ